ncbi:DUF551 domain-containing protein, partial [uncultured Hyphomicrobium sp.]|uniref:DUF551 domain-containing protein n=1 Tax=uncultured Hyphomicrobium sp. TaxID=194373 RepID=UPI0025EF746C
MTTREEQRDVVERLRGFDESDFYERPWSAHETMCESAEVIEELRAEITRLRASQAGGVPAGWKLVPSEILDRFPELNMSNYNHDDVGDLNSWGVELVLSASPPPPATALAAWQDISTAPKDGTYVDIWGVNPAGRRFPGVRWTDWPPVGAVDGFTWREERGVPVVDHADAVATNWMALPSAPGAPPPATDGALESEGLVQATVQGNGSVTLPVCQWQPIETAPKDGTWVLGFRPTSFREDQIDTWQFVHRSCDPPIWINSADSNDEDEQPTHWMPLPLPPDDRTNGSEAQSGSLNQALPASSVSATDAVEAERRLREALA